MIVVGGGFAGLAAITKLSSKEVDVLWIDRRNYHLFQPLLYQVATGALEPEAIASPLRRTTRKQPNIRVLLGEVTSIDLKGRTVCVSESYYPYDYLVLAMGSITNIPALTGNTEIHELKSLQSSVWLRSAVLATLEKAAALPDSGARDPLLNFVVVGGGPTGVEYAAALADLLYRRLPADYPELSLQRARIVLLQGGDTVLPFLPPSLRDHATRTLRQLGVDIRLHSRVKDFAGNQVSLTTGDPIAAHLLVWTAGIRATPLAASLAVAKGPSGRIAVTPRLQIADHPEVFVAGDLAWTEGSSWPQAAPFARQSGAYAARALLATHRRHTLEDFQYRDWGNMVVLRPFDAVADLPWLRMRLRGLLGWMIWFGLHITSLVGFRNRFAALLDWGTDFARRDAAVRLIMAKEDSP